MVLEVGCGNSRIGEELLREGVAGGITCIDLSPVAVHRMRDRLAEQGTSGVDVVVADMLDLPFESEIFDLVIEKGTMVCVGDPWNPIPTIVDNVIKMRKSHTFVVDFSKHLSLHGVSSGKPLVMASIISSTSYNRFNVCQPPPDPHAVGPHVAPADPYTRPAGPHPPSSASHPTQPRLPSPAATPPATNRPPRRASRPPHPPCRPALGRRTACCL
ncbi:hypothetical protein ZWY2020_015343 [Hordeum vulgare]|nr:hypothetical protein ZWY2020_015343 [Hordeum vulgare]